MTTVDTFAPRPRDTRAATFTVQRAFKPKSNFALDTVTVKQRQRFNNATRARATDSDVEDSNSKVKRTINSNSPTRYSYASINEFDSASDSDSDSVVDSDSDSDGYDEYDFRIAERLKTVSLRDAHLFPHNKHHVQWNATAATPIHSAARTKQSKPRHKVRDTFLDYDTFASTRSNWSLDKSDSSKAKVTSDPSSHTVDKRGYYLRASSQQPEIYTATAQLDPRINNRSAISSTFTDARTIPAVNIMTHASPTVVTEYNPHTYRDMYTNQLHNEATMPEWMRNQCKYGRQYGTDACNVKLPYNRENGTIKVLSIDGGGVRGVAPTRFLQCLEATLKRIFGADVTLANFFDVFAGTSVGGIIAAALSIGMDMETLCSVMNLPNMQGIFPPLSMFKRFYGTCIKGPLYDNAFLRYLLEKYFRTTPLRAAHDRGKLVILPTYELGKGLTHILHSEHPEYSNYSFVDALLATTAAPSYLPLWSIDNHVFADGGITTNNPANVALCGACDDFMWEEANVRSAMSNSSVPAFMLPRNKSHRNVVVMSIGTGRTVPHIENPHIANNWSLLQWVTYGKLHTRMMDPEPVHQQMERILGTDEKHYLRVNTALPSTCSSDLDDASYDNIMGLVGVGDAYFKQKVKPAVRMLCSDIPGVDLSLLDHMVFAD